MRAALLPRRAIAWALGLAALSMLVLSALPSQASAALPGKLIARSSMSNQAYLADATLWTTSPNGCFYTFREGYPCLRIMRPTRIWIVGFYTQQVGWEFGDGATSGVNDGWTVRCSKNRRVAERSQIDRDGLEPDQMWTDQVKLQLPLPMARPDWCEVDAETSSPSGTWGDMNQYAPWWDTDMFVNSQLQIRATTRRR